MDFLRGGWEMLQGLLRDLLAWTESFAATPQGVWALAGLSFAESSFFPIPPDVLLLPLCLGDPSRSFYFAAVCSAASVLGGMAGYGIGYAGGRPLLVRLFRPEVIEKVGSYYDRYNAWATGIAGLTPIPYKLFTLAGGAFAIDFKVFVLASVLSRSARFFGIATLVYFFGESVQQFVLRYLDWLSVAFVVALVLGFWLVGRRTRAVGRGA